MFRIDIKKISVGHLNKMLKAAARLKRFSADNAVGWGDYCLLLETYVKNLMEHKKNFNFSQASDEQIYQMKLYDRDIWLINNFIKKIPSLFINNLDQEIKKRREEADMPSEGEI